eukprot:12431360-Karenia_brevis.AAC.1
MVVVEGGAGHVVNLYSRQGGSRGVGTGTPLRVSSAISQARHIWRATGVVPVELTYQEGKNDHHTIPKRLPFVDVRGG